MRSYVRILVICVSLSVALWIQVVQAERSANESAKENKQQMNVMWSSLLNLLVRLEGNDGSLDASDTAQVLDKLNDAISLVQMSKNHELLNVMSSTLRYAKLSAKSKDFDMTRFHVNSLVNTCISCHVSSGVVGPEHKQVTDRLSLSRRADIAFLVNDYDHAADLYYRLASDANEPIDRYNYLVRYLLIMLRPDEDSSCVSTKKREEISAGLGRFARLHDSLLGEIKTWRQQLKDLQNDDVCQMHSDVKLSAAHLLSWLERSENEHDPDLDVISVKSLRSFWYIKRVLSEIAGERSWYVAGMFFSRLGGLSIDEHPELYLSRCIREGENLRVKCFNGYRDYLYRIYTGSSGTHLPKAEVKKILQLRKLANMVTTRPEGT